MSAALARPRRRFDDELLTRSGRDYELTPFAVELLPEVQHAPRLIGRALDVEEIFEPATSRHTFRLMMSDFAIAVVHEPLVQRVSEHAPGVRLEIDHMGTEIRSSDRIRVRRAGGAAGVRVPGESRPLWRDRMVCLVDAHHPRLSSGGLTLEDLATLRHATAPFGRGSSPR